MGKIIKFDPNRRRPDRGRKDAPDWTKPEDYGVPPPLRPAKPRRERMRQSGGPPPIASAGGSALAAKLAVAGIVGAGILVSLFGLT